MPIIVEFPPLDATGGWILDFGEQQVVIGMRISSDKSEPYSKISPALKSLTSIQFPSSSHTH